MRSWKKESERAFCTLDLQDEVVESLTKRSDSADIADDSLIEAECARGVLDNPRGHSAAIGRVDCAHCRHDCCSYCEDCSVAKQYSDYWICHGCGELNLRVPNCN